MNDEIQHYGVKGMKWGVRRFQPYSKGKKVKGGKEIGKAKSLKSRYVNAMERADAKSAAGTAKRRAAPKNAINKIKEDRAAKKEKNNPKGVSLKQLKKERVRIAKEEHAKAKKGLEKDINRELKELSDFARKHNLDQDDGGGGSLKAGAEFNRRLDNIQNRQYNLTKQVNENTASRLIEEYGDTAVQRIDKSTERKLNALVAASLAIPLSAIGMIAIEEIYG